MSEGIEEVRSGSWPANARFTDAGLELAGVSAEALAREHGTPLFVIDEDHFRARCREFARCFPRALYAVKAFTARELIRTAAEEGLGLLVASGGELEACLRAGVDPHLIAFHGNNKSDEELELAVRSGVGLVIGDHATELERLDAIARAAARRQNVLVRVVPDVTAGTHRYIETGERDSKFGTPIEGGLALEAIRAAAERPSLEYKGIHVHVGSQVLRVEPFVRAAHTALELAADVKDELGVDTPLLDLGGGFGVAYTDEAVPLPTETAEEVLAAVREGAAARGLGEPEVLVEPGRAIVANAVVTLYRVGSVKRTPGGRTLVAVDGGMSDNIRPMLYGARYAVASAGEPRRSTARGHSVTVVGKHCESGDVLADEVLLSGDPAPGDLLAFAATGAYGYSMASNYNRIPRPAVVTVREGESRPVLRRETADDMDRLEID